MGATSAVRYVVSSNALLALQDICVTDIRYWILLVATDDSSICYLGRCVSIRQRFTALHVATISRNDRSLSRGKR